MPGSGVLDLGNTTLTFDVNIDSAKGSGERGDASRGSADRMNASTPRLNAIWFGTAADVGGNIDMAGALFYGHISSPQVVVDHEHRQFLMYFHAQSNVDGNTYAVHGPFSTGERQTTGLATSMAGLNFNNPDQSDARLGSEPPRVHGGVGGGEPGHGIRNAILGNAYFAPFNVGGALYALSNSGTLWKAPHPSNPGFTATPRTPSWHAGPNPIYSDLLEAYSANSTPQQTGSPVRKAGDPRHLSASVHTLAAPTNAAASAAVDAVIEVFYTARGEKPERIFRAALNASQHVNWRNWSTARYPGAAAGGSPKRRSLLHHEEVLRPSEPWEGAEERVMLSKQGRARGGLKGTLSHALRDPNVFTDGDGARYLLYSGGGEHGIGLARLCDDSDGGEGDDTTGVPSSSVRLAAAKTPLVAAWKPLHGDAKSCTGKSAATEFAMFRTLLFSANFSKPLDVEFEADLILHGDAAALDSADTSVGCSIERKNEHPRLRARVPTSQWVLESGHNMSLAKAENGKLVLETWKAVDADSDAVAVAVGNANGTFQKYDHDAHAVLWLNAVIPDSFALHFGIQVHDNGNNKWSASNVLLFAATSLNGLDDGNIFGLHQPVRAGWYPHYRQSCKNRYASCLTLKGYTFTYLRGGRHCQGRQCETPKLTNLRRNPSSRGRCEIPEHVGTDLIVGQSNGSSQTQRVYEVIVVKRHGVITATVDGEVSAEWEDDTPLGAGFIGLRQMKNSARCTYHWFDVYTI